MKCILSSIINKSSFLRKYKLNKIIELKEPIVDLRSEDSYYKKHIIKSTNIPFFQIEDRLNELPPKQSEIILLSDNKDEINLSSSYLESKGYIIKDSFIADKFFWDDVKSIGKLEYNSNESRILWKPNPVLECLIFKIEEIRKNDNLPSCGKALDIACGGGRDSLFLSLRGWNVTGVDINEENISKVKHIYEKSPIVSKGHLVLDVFDIEKDFDIFANNYRNYDLINISRYLYRPLFDIIADQLNEGGFILIHQFMEGSFRPRKERFLLKDKELYNTFTDKGFKVIEDKIHYLNDGRPTSWFLARKQ